MNGCEIGAMEGRITVEVSGNDQNDREDREASKMIICLG